MYTAEAGLRIVQEMTFVNERLARRKWYVEAERSGMVWTMM